MITYKRSDFKINGEFRLSNRALEISDSREVWDTGGLGSQLYNGISFGLQYPNGTSDSVLLPEIGVPNISAELLEYQVVMEGLEVSLECQPVLINNLTRPPGNLPLDPLDATSPRAPGPKYFGDIETDDCKIVGAEMALGPQSGGDYHQPNVTHEFQARAFNLPCNTRYNGTADPDHTDDSAVKLWWDSSLDSRIVLSLTELRFPPMNRSNLQTAPEPQYVESVTAILCKPMYSIKYFQVGSPDRINGSAKALPLVGKTRQLKDFSAAAMGLAVLHSTKRWDPMGHVEDWVVRHVPTFFQLMAKNVGSSTVAAFTDTDLMTKAATNVFKGIGVQVMRELCLGSASIDTAAKVTTREQRLKVTPLIAGVLCGLFALLAMISVASLLTRITRVVPLRTGSLVSIAAILSASPHLQALLKEDGLPQYDSVRKSLQGFHYRTTASSQKSPGLGITIEPLEHEVQVRHKDPNKKDNPVSWWGLLAGTWWFQTLAIFLPVAVIISLEVLQNISNKHDGILDLKPDAILEFAVFIPAAVAVGVSSMYSSLDFMASMFAPYVALKRGKATAAQSIGLNLQGKLLPHAGLIAIKSRHFSVLVILLASFLGGFLTIITSGLYTPIDIPRFEHVSILRDDLFNVSEEAVTVPGSAALMIHTMIEYIDLDYPAWTFEDLAFSHLANSSNLFPRKIDERMELSLRMPAVRPGLNCKTVPNEDVHAVGELRPFGSNSDGTFSEYLATASLRISLDANTWCETTQQGNISFSNITVSHDSLEKVPSDREHAYFGLANLLKPSDYQIDGESNPFNLTSLNESASWGCPSFWAMFGWLRLVDNATTSDEPRQVEVEKDFATILCYQQVEEVEADLTYNLPGFGLSKGKPPRLVETSAKLLKNDAGSERFEFFPPSWPTQIFDPVENRTIDGLETNKGRGYLDSFINLLISGNRGRPWETLSGESNSQNLAEAAAGAYGRFLAQEISLNMRTKTSSTEEAEESYQGTVKISGRRRLRQNRESKIAMQVVLGVMAACATAAWFLLPTKEVLPLDSGSIAGKAALLAGGHLVTSRVDEVLPSDGGWRDNGEAWLTKAFGRDLYTLKWWDGQEGKRYGIDVDYRN